MESGRSPIGFKPGKQQGNFMYTVAFLKGSKGKGRSVPIQARGAQRIPGS